MTSYSDVQTAVLAMKLGAFDYLQKPINPTILQQKIDLAMKQPKPVVTNHNTAINALISKDKKKENEGAFTGTG